MSKLKPCPFCESTNVMVNEIEEDGTNTIFCGDCFCKTANYADYNDAVEAWNTRTNDKLTNFLKQCASFADSQDAFDSCALNGIAINAKVLLDELNA